MFRIVLAATGISREDNPTVAQDIELDFKDRSWNQNVHCYWDDQSRLILEAENDFDDDGRALLDEFSDEISACAENVGDGGLEVISVRQM